MDEIDTSKIDAAIRKTQETIANNALEIEQNIGYVKQLGAKAKQ